MQPWQKTLSQGLEYSDDLSQADLHIDQLLSWYGQLGRDEPDGYTTELLQRYGEHDLRVRFERCVDRIFLHSDSLEPKLFPSELAIGDAKIRYRKLMRVFHPDRGFNDEQWLNSKAESINTLYQQFNRLISSTEEPSKPVETSQAEQEPPVDTSKVGRKLVLRFNPNFWRKYLGKPEILKQRITYGVAAGVLIILILALLAIAIEQPTRSPDYLQTSEIPDFTPNAPESVPAKNSNRVELSESPEGLKAPEYSQKLSSKSSAGDSGMSDSNRTVAAPSSEEHRNQQPNPRSNEPKASSTAVEKSNGGQLKPEQRAAAATSSDDESSVPEREETPSSVIKQPLALARPSEVDRQVDRMLRLFKEHFVAGDEAALAKLYMTSARDNGNMGTDSIAGFYHKLFENTSARDISISIDKMRHDGLLSARLDGYLNLEFISEDNRLKGSRRFDMVIVKTSRGVKIAKFDWLQPH